MPNRILRPWTDSEAVNMLDDAGEVFFVRLIQCADDYGRYYGSPQLLKSYLYPLKDKRVADITRLIAECVKAGLIVEYEVSGKRYLEIRNFKQRQRSSVSRFPASPDSGPPTGECPSDDGHMTDTCPSDDGQMTARDERRETRDDNRELSDLSSSNSSPKRSGGKPRRITFGYDGDNLIHGITQQDLEDWKRYYPALDIEQELRNASSWLKGNPKNRKSDVLRFLTGWFQRAQQRAPRVAETPSQPQWSDKENGQNADNIF